MLTLTGSRVSLEALSMDHAAALARAGAEDRSTYAWTAVPGTTPAAERYIGDLLERRDAGTWLPFATVRLSDQVVVGCTCFLGIERWVTQTAPQNPDVVEIGSTWLAPSAQRTGLNTEAKLLMLRHAFDVWQVKRVQLKTDERNTRSRSAIERLGARFEGVLHNFQPGAGEFGAGAPRNTAMYSIVPDQWPSIRQHLEAVLAAS